MLDMEIGVNGGEGTSAAFSRDSNSWVTCTATLWLLDGMEKLRGTVKGGGGSGDPVFDAGTELLFVGDTS